MTQTVGMILSAGFGTRLLPLTEFRPKPLMELGGRPIIYFLIRMLEQAGIRDIIINLHYQPEFIRQFIEKTDFKARIHLIYEKEILGTAGGLRNAIEQFAIQHKAMVVMHGDILCDVDFVPLLDSTHFCTLLGEENRTINGYVGGLGVDNAGFVTQLGKFYQGKNPSVASGFFTGIHLLSLQAVGMIKESTESNLVAEIYPRWLHEGYDIRGILLPMYYEDLGTRERIFNANMAIVKNPSCFKHIDFLEGFHEIKPDVFMHHDAYVDPQAIIKGPVMIARGARIDAGAHVGPNVVIGAQSWVYEGAFVANSVVMSDTTIEKNEQLDCVIALSGARVLVRS